MENKIVLKRLNPADTHTPRETEFSLDTTTELSFGRDPGCEVRFDADSEDLVSRKHAKIAVSGGEFTITDLGSRNGTFVNRQRISAGMKLRAGDVIQLGAGGPEIEFDYEPKAVSARPTRMVEAQLRPTRHLNEPVMDPSPAGFVGRATVEHMIATSEKKKRTNLIGIAAGLIVVVAGAANFALHRQPDAGKDVNAAEIALANTDSIVFCEGSWKLMDMESGRPLYHVHYSNTTKNENGEESQIAPGGPPYLPVFVAVGQSLQPMLSSDDGGGNYQAIGGSFSGTGFVVSEDGFILTARHLAAAWHSRYTWNPAVAAGLVVTFDQDMHVKQRLMIPSRNFPSWIPTTASFIVAGGSGPDAVRTSPRFSAGRMVEGRNDYLDITLPHDRIRNRAALVRDSDRSDVALLKVEVPTRLRKVEIADTYDTTRAGDPAVILGYPGLSPVTLAITRSQDTFSSQQEARTVPDPTVSTGNVGKVHRSKDSTGQDGVISTVGDLYQLTIPSTSGNSGGPVFDAQGRVFAIYNAGLSDGAATVSLAVPIRYGLELMGVTRTAKR